MNSQVNRFAFRVLGLHFVCSPAVLLDHFDVALAARARSRKPPTRAPISWEWRFYLAPFAAPIRSLFVAASLSLLAPRPGHGLSRRRGTRTRWPVAAKPFDQR